MVRLPPQPARPPRARAGRPQYSRSSPTGWPPTRTPSRSSTVTAARRKRGSARWPAAARRSAAARWFAACDATSAERAEDRLGRPVSDRTGLDRHRVGSPVASRRRRHLYRRWRGLGLRRGRLRRRHRSGNRRADRRAAGLGRRRRHGRQPDARGRPTARRHCTGRRRSGAGTDRLRRGRAAAHRVVHGLRHSARRQTCRR